MSWFSKTFGLDSKEGKKAWSSNPLGILGPSLGIPNIGGVSSSKKPKDPKLDPLALTVKDALIKMMQGGGQLPTFIQTAFESGVGELNKQTEISEENILNQLQKMGIIDSSDTLVEEGLLEGQRLSAVANLRNQSVVQALQQQGILSDLYSSLTGQKTQAKIAQDTNIVTQAIADQKAFSDLINSIIPG